MHQTKRAGFALIQLICTGISLRVNYLEVILKLGAEKVETALDEVVGNFKNNSIVWTWSGYHKQKFVNQMYPDKSNPQVILEKSKSTFH